MDVVHNNELDIRRFKHSEVNFLTSHMKAIEMTKKTFFKNILRYFDDNQL